METNLKELYKTLSIQAKENGYFLIPISFYEKLINALEEHKVELKRVRDVNDRLSKKIKLKLLTEKNEMKVARDKWRVRAETAEKKLKQLKKDVN